MSFGQSIAVAGGIPFLVESPRSSRAKKGMGIKGDGLSGSSDNQDVAQSTAIIAAKDVSQSAIATNDFRLPENTSCQNVEAVSNQGNGDSNMIIAYLGIGGAIGLLIALKIMKRMS